MKPGLTYRNGTARVTYRPDWDERQPWVLYIGGTAQAGRGWCLAQMLLRARREFDVNGKWWKSR